MLLSWLSVQRRSDQRTEKYKDVRRESRTEDFQKPLEYAHVNYVSM